MSGKARPAIERFMAKVQKTDGCWIWTAARHSKGYGDFGLRTGRNVRAHRFAYETFVGPCVRPDHLFVGTHLDNMADKVAKGRQPRGAALRAHRNAARRLTDEQVGKVRDAIRRGARVSVVAKDFGISERYAYRLATGESRRDAHGGQA